MRLAGFLFAAFASLAGATEVDSFSPTGTVKGVRQVRAHFTGQMVAFGELRLEPPFNVDCGSGGTGRWADGENWSYDFERDLPAGLNCSFTLKAGLKDLAGKALSGAQVFRFSTGGPAVVRSSPHENEWQQIDEQQIFVLGLDAPATDESMLKHVTCQAEGIEEKIGVRLITGEEREQILKMKRDFATEYLNLYFRHRGLLFRTLLGNKDQRLQDSPLVVLQCKRSLPADVPVSIVWGAGVRTASGVATTEDQKLAFRTRPDFNARFSCERTNSNEPCIPFLPMRVEFTAPIRAADALAIRLAGPGNKLYKAHLNKDEAKAPVVSAVEFPGPFPEQSKFTVQLPSGLKDDAGRSLNNASLFPMSVGTAEQPPLVKFPARFGILEAKGDKLLPLTVRNVEAALSTAVTTLPGATERAPDGDDLQIIAWLRTLSGNERSWTPSAQWGESLERSVLDKQKAERFALPRPAGKQAFEVIGIPLKGPGFYVVEIESPKLGAALNRDGVSAFVSAAALVTNMSVHFKHGKASSLVWVTSLDKGLPVAGADVAVRGCDGKLLWTGPTGKDGLARIAKDLLPSKCGYSRDMFISARSAGDMSFTLSNWQSGIENWRFNLPGDRGEGGNAIYSTVFARTLLRAGETVHMKHFLREHTMGGFAPRRGKGKGMIRHDGSSQEYDMPLVWSPNGSAEFTWKVPEDAKLGEYTVLVDGNISGNFRVEQYRLPTMKAVLQAPKAAQVRSKSVQLDLQLNYLAGGAAANAPVKVSTQIVPRQLAYSDYEDFNFNAGDVLAGTKKYSGSFDGEDGDMEAGEEGALEHAGATPTATQSLILDAGGGARVKVDQLGQPDTVRTLIAEMSYQDANGETLSKAMRLPLYPSRYIIGIKPDAWLLTREALKFQVLVLDVDGKPVQGAAVESDFFQRTHFTHRRRLVGGFYAYESSTDTQALGAACTGLTDAKGLLFCDMKAPAEGNLILRARTKDADGYAAVTNRDIWVAGENNWWSNTSDNDRIDLLPEKKRYEPGEEAGFQVRMPFAEATALITVEREGIINGYVRTLTRAKPHFTIPIKGNYAPNVFVSALVVRGRVAAAAPTALVDLGKPAYKLGIAQVRVGWAAHELKVQVSADKPSYHPREQAKVQVKVTQPDGKPLPAGSEVALAAVDVGLLELKPNTSWDLLEAMMQQRGLQVQTSTAQMQVIGKRHFGRKAVAPGGGGGRGAARELFDTLLFWKARVTLDANGEASVSVPLNDSLTAFRIVAVANAGAGLFGTGKTDIRSGQDLMLLSGLPPMVREGDRYRAGFTVRNASESALDIALDARMGAKALARQQLSLAAGAAQDLAWDVQVPLDVAELQWEINASTAAGLGDRLKLRQEVKAAVPVRTYQASLMQLDQAKSMQVQMPADAIAGRGGIQAAFVARLGNAMPGVEEYMRQYPYTCMEQVASRAIALRDPKLWASAHARLPSHLDGDGLVKYFASMEYGSDVLTAYLLSVSTEAGYQIEEHTRKRMEAALLGFVQGKILRSSSLATADLAVRKIAAIEALSRTQSVQDDWFESFGVEPNLWPTSAVIDYYQILHRAPALRGRDTKLAQTASILRSRLNFQGTTMGFSTERRDQWWWLMISGDVNANRLVLAMLDNPAWAGDMGRMVRGALGRQQKGHWNTTVANAWGTLAIEKFSEKFESVPVAGSSTASLGKASKAVNWGADKGSTSLMLPWPAAQAELSLAHQGTGKPWVTVQSLAAIALKAPLSSGYKINKTITPLEQKVKGRYSKGDVYRVHLDLEAQSDMSWVVVDDPIPASATVLGTGLGNDSQLATSGERQRGVVWPAFQERRFDAFRSYFEFVPKGKWSVEYTVRLNNAGQFSMPPLRVEAMYSPEMFGELPSPAVEVMQ